MPLRPSRYSTLSLVQKRGLCAKAAMEPTWNPSKLAQWATAEFKTPTNVGVSTVRGILKRKQYFNDVPEVYLN
ncbi:hypothetical protein ON010_g17930 [Phytophthora cinnamomi]|nr:hypothetical protein ON010_g17930 [Phytophthora cinnamomi]